MLGSSPQTTAAADDPFNTAEVYSESVAMDDVAVNTRVSPAVENGDPSPGAASAASPGVASPDMSSPVMDNYDGLDEDQKHRTLVIQHVALGLAALQLVASAGFTIAIRILQATGGCIDPTDFNKAGDFEKFKASGKICDLSYTLLLILSWSPQVPMLLSGPMNLVCGFLTYHIIAAAGVVLHTFVTVSMVGVTIAMIATGWPFAAYTLPLLIMTIVSGIGIVTSAMLLAPFALIKVAHERIYREERARRREHHAMMLALHAARHSHHSSHDGSTDLGNEDASGAAAPRLVVDVDAAEGEDGPPTLPQHSDQSSTAEVQHHSHHHHHDGEGHHHHHHHHEK